MASLHLPPRPPAPGHPATGAGGGEALQAALRRHGRPRDFRSDALAAQQVQELLASAFDGIRSCSWGRAAPSARSWQSLALFVLLPEAAYRYDLGQHRLVPVKTGDLRPDIGKPDFTSAAPVHLVYVVDFDALEQTHAEEHGVQVGADAGCIVENVYRSCASAGLATALRGAIDRRRLATALGLGPTQRIELAQAIGHTRTP